MFNIFNILHLYYYENKKIINVLKLNILYIKLKF